MHQFYSSEGSLIKKIAAILIFGFFSLQVSAQIDVVSNNNGTQLANIIAGNGVTIENVNFNCADGAAGTFNCVSCNLGIDSGIVLTTGCAYNVPGPNTSGSTSCYNFYPGDQDLADLEGLPISELFDACVLEFDMTVLSDSVRFNYVFASEEYPEYACSGFNDVFAFFISGPGIAGQQNIALIPGTNVPVSINTVNEGPGLNSNNSCDVTYPEYYVDNGDGFTYPYDASPYYLQYDGLTTVLQANAGGLQPCQVYHLKLAISDVGDEAYDSGVFIEANSLNSNAVSLDSVRTTVPGVKDAVRGCVDGIFTFQLQNPVNQNTTVHFEIGGTAVAGVDYNNVPDSVIIHAGNSSAQIFIVPTVHPAQDSLTVVVYLFTTCSNVPYDSAVLLILDTVGRAVSVSSPVICVGTPDTLTIFPTISGDTYSWSPGGGSLSSIIVTPTITTTYTVTYHSVCGTNTASGKVTVVQAPTLVTTTDTICAEGTAQISATPSVNGGTYSWSPGGYTTSTISVSPGITTTYTVTYLSPNCGSITATAQVVVSPPPTVTTTGASICVGNQAQISATPSIGGGTYSWSPGDETTSSITVSPATTTTYTVTYILSGCGSVTATATVNVTPVPTVTANGTILCHGDTGQISATPNPAGGTYSWSPGGATTGTVTVSPATTATYTVTYTLNGCSATDVATVTVNALPVIQLTTTNATCGEQNGKIVASASGATSPYSYFWSNLSDVSTPVDSGLGTGPYTVHVFDENGCSASASTTVSQSSQVSATDTVQPFPCAKPPYGSVIITATGGIAPYTYSIEGVDTNITGQFNPVAPGEYSYTVTDTTGCTVSGSFVVPSGFAKDSFDITADSTSCFGLSDGSVTITPILTPNQPYTYSINGGTPETGTVFDSLPAGDYQVIVHNNIGCTDTLNTIVYQPDPVTVNIIQDTIPIPNRDTTDAILSTINGFINPVYFWYPSSGLSCTSCIAPKATADESSVVAPLVYYLQVSDSLNGNCKAYDSVIVLITGQFKMPDAFTPNGDGKNDLFGPAKHSYLTIKEFHIYNRWGQLIHNSTDLWDGKYKGEEQPAATYVYYIVVEYPDPQNPAKTITKKQEGSVVLLR